MENIDVFTLGGTDIYSFCTEELPNIDTDVFIIDCPTCSLSRDKITTDTYMEAIEFVAPSNGYFLIGFLENKYDIYKIIESLYNIDLSKVQTLPKNNFIFKGHILLYEGRPFSYVSSQFHTLQGNIILMSIPYELIYIDPYWHTVFRSLDLDDVKGIMSLI